MLYILASLLLLKGAVQNGDGNANLERKFLYNMFLQLIPKSNVSTLASLIV